MGIARFALDAVVRSRRRTLSSILGVLLAITFISGTFIAIDSSTRTTLDALLASTQSDFSYYSGSPYPAPPTPVNASDVQASVLAIPGVTDASTWTYLPTAQLAQGPGSYYYAQMAGIDPGHLPGFLRGATVVGSMSLPRGTVAVTSDLVVSAGLSLNSTLTLVNSVWDPSGRTANYTLNLTVVAILSVPPRNVGLPIYIGPSPPFFGGGTVAIDLRDASWYASQLNFTDWTPAYQGDIWIDRGRFINPYDTEGSTRNLLRLERQIQTALSSAGLVNVSVADNLLGPLQSYQSLLAVERIQYFILSLPVILLGLYLGAVGVDLGHAERRRELAVLRTRGASRRQVVGLLLLESVLGGILAAIVGLLLGIGLSRVLMGVVLPFGGAATAASEISLTPDTIISVAILSILFMALASYRSARRTAALAIIETLRYYAPGETRIHYTPTWDILMVGYGAVTYGMVLYTQASTANVFVFLVAFVFVASLPLAPLFLILGISRLATRATGRIYVGAARLSRPFTKSLSYVVGRNLHRNPRRSSNIAVIIALGLAFGVLVLGIFGSQVAFQENSIRANIGADMSAYAGYYNGSIDKGFAQNLSAIPGIAGSTSVTFFSSFSVYGSYADVAGLDPANYFAVSQPDPFYFENPGSAAQAQALLSTKGNVLVTRNLADAAALEIGDSVVLSQTSYVNGVPQGVSVSVTVAGVVRFLPGTYTGSFFGSAVAPNEVYGSLATLEPLSNANLSVYFPQPDRYLIKLAPGADWRTVKADIESIRGTNVAAYQEQVDQLLSNPLQSAYLGFLEAEIAFIGVILTAGIGLIIYAASLERDVEFAGIIARGASGWQAAGLLVGEALAILVIGFIIGVAVGLATGYLYASFLFTGFGPTGEIVVPFLFVLPWAGLYLLTLAPAAMLLAALFVSWRLARMNVAQVLKMRGG